MNVAMTNKESALLEAFVKVSTNYLEFGSGGSTYLAAKHVRNRIITVDSSCEWLESVKTAVSTLSTAPQLVLNWVDIGKTGEWGYPVGDSSKDRWPSYSTSVWNLDGASKSDLFLIDGRFRVACFAETLVRSTAGSVIMIHDFEDRPAYHVVLQFATRIAIADKLSVFVKDDRADLATAMRVADEYRYQAQ